MKPEMREFLEELTTLMQKHNAEFEAMNGGRDDPFIEISVGLADLQEIGRWVNAETLERLLQ